MARILRLVIRWRTYRSVLIIRRTIRTQLFEFAPFSRSSASSRTFARSACNSFRIAITSQCVMSTGGSLKSLIYMTLWCCSICLHSEFSCLYFSYLVRLICIESCIFDCKFLLSDVVRICCHVMQWMTR
jgi:hypothetical protein